MSIEKIIIPAAMFAAGIALGYGVAPVEQVTAEQSRETATVKEVRLGTEGSEESLRAQIADLRRQLAEAKGNHGGGVEEERLVASEREGGESMRGERPQSPREFMERMKKERPEEYARMTNGMARMRQRRIDRAQAKLDFFGSIDTAGMSESDREKTQTLQALLVKREELMAQFNPENEMSDDERQALFNDMRETEEAVRELNGEVREALLKQTVSTLGLDDETAEEVAATVQDIYDATSGGPGGPGGPGDGRGPGGGRGGQGGRGPGGGR